MKTHASPAGVTKNLRHYGSQHSYFPGVQGHCHGRVATDRSLTANVLKSIDCVRRNLDQKGGDLPRAIVSSNALRPG